MNGSNGTNGSNSRQPVVTPRDCALAIAVPLTKQDFYNDLNRPERDFARFTMESHALSPLGAWKCFEEDADTISRICKEVEKKMGVTVNPAVRLADMSTLMARFPVVTLLSHFRFPPIEKADVLDVQSILCTLQKPHNAIQEALHDELVQEDADLLAAETLRSNTPNRLTSRLAKALKAINDEAYENLKEMPKPQKPPDYSKPLIRLTRVLLEKEFPDALRAGKCIEFADGMVSIPEFIKAIPAGSAGLLDLTLCNSIFPAEAIKPHRKDWQFACNRYTTSGKIRIEKYKQIISALNKSPSTYSEAMARSG